MNKVNTIKVESSLNTLSDMITMKLVETGIEESEAKKIVVKMMKSSYESVKELKENINEMHDVIWDIANHI